MKLKYQAKKGNRVKYRFMGMTTYDDVWFNNNTNRWEQNPKIGENEYCSHQSCRSVRAFRRKLKKAPNGFKFVLESRWRGYDVFGVGSCMNF